MRTNSFATAMLKMKTLPGGYPWFSVVPRSSFLIDLVIEVFSSSELLILSFDVLDFLDVSVSAIAAFPPSERLAFKGIVLMQRHILASVEESFEAHQHSNEESNVWRSVNVQLSWLKSRVCHLSCFLKHLLRLVEYPLSFTDTVFAPQLPLATMQTNEERQGNLLQGIRANVLKKMSEDQKLSRPCSEASLRDFCALPSARGKAKQSFCREYTLPRDQKGTRTKGCIQGNIRFGPVSDITSLQSLRKIQY